MKFVKKKLKIPAYVFTQEHTTLIRTDRLLESRAIYFFNISLVRIKIVLKHFEISDFLNLIIFKMLGTPFIENFSSGSH